MSEIERTRSSDGKSLVALMDDAATRTNDRASSTIGHPSKSNVSAAQVIIQSRLQYGPVLGIEDFDDRSLMADLASVLSVDEASSIWSMNHREPAALSPAQQRLWLLHQLDPQASLAFHTVTELRLSGDLDRAAFTAALQCLVERHAALRTRFALTDGQPTQIIDRPHRRIAYAEDDLSHLPLAEQDRAVATHRDQEAGTAFDFARGPVFRARLLRLSDTDTVLLLVYHGIIADAQSATVLVQELCALYSASRRGSPNPLKPLAIQYADVVTHHQDSLARDRHAGHLSFWKTYLADLPPLLELPTDRLRPPTPTYRHGQVSFPISAALVVRLRRLSQRNAATTFMTLLAAWTALLSRLSGQQDILVAASVPNRGQRNLAALVGPLENTLALRVRLEGAPNVAECLARIRDSVLDALAHATVPFGQVVDALHLHRDPGHAPVLQIGFAMNRASAVDDLAIEGLAVSHLKTTDAAARFDLALSVDRTGDAMTGRLHYAVDLFDHATIERMAGHFNTLLSDMVADDTQSLERLALLSDAERTQLLVDFNQTSVPFPSCSLIQLEFERWVERTPDAVAVTFGSENVTYVQLNMRANRLAHRLIELGVRPDDRVGICVARSADVVVGLLAILKAGGAYLPLDPTVPAERLRQMLDDSNPVALVTQMALRDAVPTIGGHIVVLDQPEDAEFLSLQSSDNPDPVALGLTSRHLAYTIYTSGSTGVPKGVMIEHRSVLRLVINNDCAPIKAVDCVAHCANLAFDISTWEIWGTLLNGGRLVVIDSPTLLDPQRFAAILREQRVTMLCLAVGLFNEYAEAVETAFADLDYLSVGGDALDPHVVAKVVSSPHAPRRFANTYGPTEATTWASMHEVRSVAADARSIPIGRPIANTQIYVLDPLGTPVPIGVVGEILIGGPGVARGYLNRPDLTRERFIPDYLGAEPGGYLYRTGDLGRWLPDGTVEFLGRNDNQVKIRGFRIELGEIEVRLAACADVREAVVIARQRTASGKQLIAYLTAQPGHTLSPAELRLELSRILPDYMIPTAFITVPAFPLTPNGKLDRRALPAPPEIVSVEPPPYAPPRGTLETTLAEIWCTLFEIRRVGRNDHFFFDLGGNSLLAVRLATQISRRLGANLPLAMLFRAPSVAALATLLTDELAVATGRLRGAGHADWSPLVEITPENGTVPLFCLHGAGGNVLIFAELARILGPQQPIFGLQARGIDGKQPAFDSFEAMVEAHLSEIRRACPNGPYYLAGYSGGGVVAFEIAQRLKAEGKAVALLAMLDTGCPTLFGRWVPLRVRIARSRSKGELASTLNDLMPHKIIERQYRKLCYKIAHRMTARGTTVPFHFRNAYLAFSLERLYTQYLPQRFDGRVLLFNSASAKSAWSTDPDLGWASFVADGIEVVKVDGGHEDMMRAPHIRQVANRLRKALPLGRDAGETVDAVSVMTEGQAA